MNSCSFIGKVYRKPFQPDGSSYPQAKFTLHVKRDKEDYNYIPILAWQDLKNQALELNEGDLVVVHGYYSSNSVKKNGEWRYYHNIVAKQLEKIDPEAVGPDAGDPVIPEDDHTNELPF